MAEPAYLLDSNICIYLLEGLSEAARRKLEQCRPNEVATSAVAYAEVMRGIDWSDEIAASKAEALFGVIPVLPFGRAAAEAYRTIPFRRTSYDRLIAAHALSLDLTFITNNQKDFQDVVGLKVENWTEA